MEKSDDTRELIEEMNRYYDRRAPWHDQYMSYESNERMEEMFVSIIKTIEKMITGKRVLELACGTGNWTQVLARRAASVTATDISPKALEIAQTKLTACKNVSLIQSDAYGLDNIEDSFDVVFAADWWSHIPKDTLPSFLRVIMRKLHAEAPAIFVDMSINEYFQQESCYYDNGNNRISVRRLPDGSEFRVVKNFPDESDLRELLDGYARNAIYYEFSSLQRWMVVFRRT